MWLEASLVRDLPGGLWNHLYHSIINFHSDALWDGHIHPSFLQLLDKNPGSRLGVCESVHGDVKKQPFFR